MLSASAPKAYKEGDLADIVYADDTLLLGSSAKHLEEFLRAVAAAGKKYSLELHEGKFQLLQVGGGYNVRNASGQTIDTTRSLSYLGASLASDGRVGSELSRHIGSAKADFRAMHQVWKHTSLTKTRKLEVYGALVESKLLYGLSSACFTKAELRRLDGFQAKFLRTILGILPSYYSRVSNAAVLLQASWVSLSKQLQRRQVVYVGKVLRADASSPLRICSMVPGTTQPLVSHYIRRVGRPRREWPSTVLPIACQVAGGSHCIEVAAQDERRWKRLVRNFCF